VDVWQFFAPRFVIAAVLLLVFVTRRGFDVPTVRSRGAALGVVNVAIPTVLLTYATDLLPASVAGILIAFVPIATIAFAHGVVPGERFVVRRLPGVSVAVLGAAILVTGTQTPDGGSLSRLGIALGVLGVAAAGLGGALNRRYVMQTPAIELAAPQFVVAAVVLVAAAAPAGGLRLGGLDALQWLGLVLMAILSTAIPFYAILKAAETASAATVSNVGYLAPVVAAGGAILFLGDPVTTAFAAGAALILLGVWLSDRLAEPSPDQATA
jgi:drug/metabolite transporter (DMT)-like permease